MYHTSAYKNDCDNRKDHDCVALFCRFLRLLSGPTCLADIGMLLLQIKQMVELSELAAIKNILTIHRYVPLRMFSMRGRQFP